MNTKLYNKIEFKKIHILNILETKQYGGDYLLINKKKKFSKTFIEKLINRYIIYIVKILEPCLQSDTLINLNSIWNNVQIKNFYYIKDIRKILDFLTNYCYLILTHCYINTT